LWASATEDDARVARRIADAATAQLWLTEGVPFADAITMLEIHRRFEIPQNDCRIHAIQTVLVAQRENCGSKHQLIANQEEIQNAVA
jgi:hypothetical protein